MVMNSVKIVSSSNRNLEITAIPGHFVTSHSHINYYIDITMMKHDFVMAREAAVTLAQHYAYEKPVDTIICMDGSEVIGAFLAQELAKITLHRSTAKRTFSSSPPSSTPTGR